MAVKYEFLLFSALPRFTDDTSPWIDNPRADTPEDNLILQFGKPGAGAPLRTTSGKVRTGYQSDAAIRFQVNGQSNNLIDKEVRYLFLVNLLHLNQPYFLPKTHNMSSKVQCISAQKFLYKMKLQI